MPRRSTRPRLRGALDRFRVRPGLVCIRGCRGRTNLSLGAAGSEREGRPSEGAATSCHSAGSDGVGGGATVSGRISDSRQLTTNGTPTPSRVRKRCQRNGSISRPQPSDWSFRRRRPSPRSRDRAQGLGHWLWLFRPTSSTRGSGIDRDVGLIAAMVSSGDRRGQVRCSQPAVLPTRRSTFVLPLVLDRLPRVPGLPPASSGLGGR